jgi:hypothetical protein
MVVVLQLHCPFYDFAITTLVPHITPQLFAGAAVCLLQINNLGFEAVHDPASGQLLFNVVP